MEFLTALFLGKAVWVWLAFLAIVLVLLLLDLGVLHKKNAEIGVSQSLWMSAFYIGAALLYGAWIWWQMGQTSAIQYYTGFFIEKTLALDNIFVISLIFTYFAIPRKYQHRVLFWGILGVIVLRGIMIALGAALVQQFDWVLYVFAAFLLLTGVKMLLEAGKEHDTDMSKNPLLQFLKSRMKVTDQLHGEKFFVQQADPKTGQLVRYATPLFLALMLVEFADLIFAVDSVPAIFAITTDPFIVYTSNIFAILGLRALYFALAAMIHRFRYLKYSLSVVLIFISAKVFANQIFGKMDSLLSLGITLSILAAGIVYSLIRTEKDDDTQGEKKPIVAK
ncbi:MAG: TerC family protein [Deinococcales bacterium]